MAGTKEAPTQLSLSPQHKHIARLLALGYSCRDIARTLNINESHVSQIKDSPLMQYEVNRLLAAGDDATALQMRRMSRLADKAMDKLDELLSMAHDDDITLLKLQAEHAQQVLNKHGFGENIQITRRTSFAQMLSPEELAELKKRQSEVIDV